MGAKEQYLRNKEKLLVDKTICKENRILWGAFFEKEEYKLKRIAGNGALDHSNFLTLNAYLGRFRNVNTWFQNKPWRDLTKADVQRVYDALEDGKLLTMRGKPFKDKTSYYNKVFKSTPFKMVGKDQLFREIMEFHAPPKKSAVRFIRIDMFRQLVDVTVKPKYKALLWLAFDVGENINALLKLKKGNFTKTKNPHTHQDEYLVNLPRELLKRSRQERTEPTIHSETFHWLEIILKDKEDDDHVFNFDYGQSKKVLDRAVKLTGAKCLPNGEKFTWKDLRSSMTCYLHEMGWSRDELNARLGHVPSSNTIDHYLNFLAKDKQRAKKKVYQYEYQAVRDSLEEAKQREKLQEARIQKLNEQMAQMHVALKIVAEAKGSLNILEAAKKFSEKKRE